MVEVSTWMLRPDVHLEAFQWIAQIRTNQEFDEFPVWFNSRKHSMHVTGNYLHFVSRGRTMIAHRSDWIVKGPDGPLILPNEVFQAWMTAWLPADKAANLADPDAAVETHVIRG